MRLSHRMKGTVEASWSIGIVLGLMNTFDLVGTCHPHHHRLKAPETLLYALVVLQLSSDLYSMCLTQITLVSSSKESPGPLTGHRAVEAPEGCWCC